MLLTRLLPRALLAALAGCAGSPPLAILEPQGQGKIVVCRGRSTVWPDCCIDEIKEIRMLVRSQGLDLHDRTF